MHCVSHFHATSIAIDEVFGNVFRQVDRIVRRSMAISVHDKFNVSASSNMTHNEVNGIVSSHFGGFVWAFGYFIIVNVDALFVAICVLLVNDVVQFLLSMCCLSNCAIWLFVFVSVVGILHHV